MYIIYDISRAVQEDSIIEVILTPVTRGFLFVDLNFAHTPKWWSHQGILYHSI